jgi:hypothetical protein
MNSLDYFSFSTYKAVPKINAKMTSQTITEMNSFTFLFKAMKKTHEQCKTKIACMNSEAGQLTSPFFAIYIMYRTPKLHVLHFWEVVPVADKSIPQYGLLPLVISSIHITSQLLTISSNWGQLAKSR